jgi:hypothetical protein
VTDKFNSRVISASRVNKYLGCGIAFKRYYIDNEPESNLTSHALFGLVIHRALEDWAMDRSQDLVSLVSEAWDIETEDTVANDFLAEYRTINISVLKAEASARASWERRNPGKTSKAPRMTKDFKESQPAKDLAAMLKAWLPKLNSGSPWEFSERDPLPALYDESLILGKRYAAKYKDLPNAISTEFKFDVRWEGFSLRGFIDSIEPLIDKETGVIRGIQVIDYKTYRAEPTPLKDWRQGVIYDIAIRDLISREVLDTGFDLRDLPIYIVFDYPRLMERIDYEMTESDYDQLRSELSMYSRGVDADLFLPPEKNAKPDFCGYGETCCMNQRNSVGQRGGIYGGDSD